ncbi:MAG: arsenate reductase (glutaredoxin) [Legionellales bacterium]|jgi:arsenate reductase|nr:arsenate reductase (glutaredoxin) [Legionellales bacterium]|tara:strand:+ start:2105 stop:2452 length:348 start_codon:yes stop_codon:yes gene_type:complete
MKVKIFHNTRCSKSRKALDILRENGVEVEIIEYLKTPLDKKDIENILKKLDMNPIDIMRKGEDIFKKLELEKHINNKQLLINAMVKHPILIERPIVISGTQAIVGRPPELILEII